MSHLPIEDTEVYLVFREAAQRGWDVVMDWNGFAKSTVGGQLVRALDSICANLVEGDGRYSDAEAIHFFTIARSSAREAKYWISVSENRGLVTFESAAEISDQITQASKMLNKLIEYRRRTKNARAVREGVPTYLAESLNEHMPTHGVLSEQTI